MNNPYEEEWKPPDPYIDLARQTAQRLCFQRGEALDYRWVLDQISPNFPFKGISEARFAAMVVQQSKL